MRRCRSRRRGSAVGAQPCRSCSRRELTRVPQTYCEGKDDTGGLQKQAEACGTAAHRLHRQVAIAAEWLLQQRRGCSRLNAWATLPSQRCGSCGRHGHVGGAQNGLRGQRATAAMQLLQQACMRELTAGAICHCMAASGLVQQAGACAGPTHCRGNSTSVAPALSLSLRTEHRKQKLTTRTQQSAKHLGSHHSCLTAHESGGSHLMSLWQSPETPWPAQLGSHLALSACRAGTIVDDVASQVACSKLTVATNACLASGLLDDAACSCLCQSGKASLMFAFDFFMIT